MKRLILRVTRWVLRPLCVLADQSYKYLAVIAGGRGPNTWDCEVEIFAPNIGWAIHLIESKFESDESIISIEQVE